MSDFNFNLDEDIQQTTDSTSTTSSNKLYANSDRAVDLGRTLRSRRGDDADEIDPRKLVRDPTLSELRWYYRRTFAKKLVNKPIEDAFKNGFEFKGRDASRAQKILDDTNFIEEYQLAEKKARRDGFALLFIGVRDTSQGVWRSPMDDDVSVIDITHTKVLTVDDLLAGSSGPNILEQVQAAYGEDMTINDFHVRETGIVVSTDITSPDFRDPIGYVLDQGNSGTFIHKDRVMHFVWNNEVDGDYVHDRNNLEIERFRGNDERTLGKWEGDSILVQSYDLMKGLTKGNWSIMQALYRNAANMYVVHVPRDAGEEEMIAAEKEFQNMNAKSEFVVPSGPSAFDEDSYEVVQYSSGDMLEPREHFDVIFDQICASHEMTKSVLFGTQTGTTTGSETDIKNYFNQVERYRQNRGEKSILEFVNRVAGMRDGRAKGTMDMDLEIDWGPLFRVSRAERIASFQNHVQAMGTAINGYLLTPDEARSILSEEWAEIDVEALTDSQKDMLDRINLFQVGQAQGGQAEEVELGENEVANNRTGGQNGGGMEQGQQTGEFSGSGV